MGVGTVPIDVLRRAGLVPVKDVASRLSVPTPVVDEMIRWHQVLMGKVSQKLRT